RYGGRVGLVRLVPILQVNNRTIYEKSAFAGNITPAIIAPDTVQLHTTPIDGLKMIFSVWVMDSYTLAGQFELVNETDTPLQIGAEIFFQGMREEKALRLNLLNLETPKGTAVALAIEAGQISHLEPVLMMQNAHETGTAKLNSPLDLAPGARGTVFFVHAALPERDKSVAAAYAGLNNANWQAHFKSIKTREYKLPQIETGDDNLDAAIQFSQQTLLCGLIAPTKHLPYPTPVFSRTPGTGYSPKGDGSDHIRTWSGQNALDTFQYAASLAVLEPKIAGGIVKNYLAVQNPDGGIDGMPGAGGQRAGYLLLPILAQLSEIVYFYSGNVDFLRDIFPKLTRFYARWFASDVDVDGDGFPEWQSEHQTGFDIHPVFS
ncbi:MAG TPA: hypothetical protein VJZ27_04705, partial [Aggregatilineales bacterium]|nr:hypothetical protein [Aggregatilineales bacterium]